MTHGRMVHHVLYLLLASLAVLQAAQAIRPFTQGGSRHWTNSAALSHEKAPWHNAAGYVEPEFNEFFALAKMSGTDKVTVHDYQTLYGKYFQKLRGRHYAKKLLEIGLGCDMKYGPGRSSKLWRKYFPAVEIWQAEYDAKCVDECKNVLDALDINPLTGDQANVTTLRGWIEKAGTDFDYIIEDGGHSNMQQFHSLIVLFVEALKPGGVYFLEDTNTNRVASYMDGDKKHDMIEIIKDWLDLLLDSEFYPRIASQSPEVAYKPKWPLPLGLKSIECSLNMCAFVKCFKDDNRCATKAMREYKLNPATGVMEASWKDPVPVYKE